MFAPHCPSCDRRVLLGTDRILGLRGGAHTEGHRVDLRCRCGTRVQWTAQPATSL